VIEMLLNLWTSLRARRTETMVRLVAERCVDEILLEIAGRTEGMSVSEAKGYIRSRATCSVLKNSRQVLAEAEINDLSQLAPLARLATERVVLQVLRKSKGQAPYRDAARQAA
jgi:hypothetical protein